MSVSSWIRRQFKNGVAVTDTVPLGFTSGATSFVAADGSTFPDGSVGPFIIVADQGTASEEKILVDSRAGSTFTVASGGRGYNGGTAYNHSDGCSILHTIDQQDLDEANQVVVATLGQIAAEGDLLVGSAANALTKLSVGAANNFLISNGTTLAYIGFGSGGGTVIGTTNQDGTSTHPARYDHTHAGVRSVNGAAGLLSFSNGYGVTGNDSNPPTPAVGLTSAAGRLANDVTMSNTSGGTTFLTTSSLGVGTWLVTFSAILDLGKTALENAEIEVVVGTASATLTGAQSCAASVEETGSNNDRIETVSMQFIATVATAGTLTFKARDTFSSAVIKALSPVNSWAGATGYAAVRIA